MKAILVVLLSVNAVLLTAWLAKGPETRALCGRAGGGAGAGLPLCPTGDVNRDGKLDVSDAVCILMRLFTTRGSCFADEPCLTAEEVGRLKEILRNVSVVEDDPWVPGRTIRFSGVNLQVVNGSGATNGNPDAAGAYDEPVTHVNGLGNLIVGYNEEFGVNPRDRSGSHNIVVGIQQAYSSFGGLLAGELNAVTAPYASVSGGASSTASGLWSSVSGGDLNVAGGQSCSVTGGQSNGALGQFSSVSGGRGFVTSPARVAEHPCTHNGPECPCPCP